MFWMYGMGRQNSACLHGSRSRPPPLRRRARRRSGEPRPRMTLQTAATARCMPWPKWDSSRPQRLQPRMRRRFPTRLVLTRHWRRHVGIVGARSRLRHQRFRQHLQETRPRPNNAGLLFFQRPRTSHTGPPHLSLPRPAWAAGRVQKLLVARSLVACGCGHALLRSRISMGTAPIMRRPTGSRSRRRGGATCRPAGCPAVRVGGSRGRHPCKR